MTKYTDLLNRYLMQHQKMNKLMDELISEYNLGIHTNKIILMIDNIIHEFSMHFQEEEMLYAKYKNKAKILITIERLRSEHDLIIQKMLDSKRASKDHKANFANIKKFLQIHEHQEEYTLYPELAQAISDEEQESILEDIRERTKIEG